MNHVVVGEVDERAVEQLERCMREGDATAGAICADGHVGYTQPIGGVIGYRDYISPSGVGYDIGCGNKAVATSLLYSDIRADLPRIMDEIFRKIHFGIGVSQGEQVDHPVVERITRDSPTREIRLLASKAAKQLGTVGGGNHYVDLFRDERTDRVWIGVHFGSRGFGHTVASGFLALAQGKAFGERVKEGEMDSPPVLFHVDSPLAHNYLEAMLIAGEYAYAGRDVVCQKVLDILGAVAIDEVHNHHNFAWRETHFGEDLWVVRKGCTPAFPGQRGFIGATMGETAVIVEGGDFPQPYSEGLDREDWARLQRDLLYSTVHGAGRVMSRMQAAGKVKYRSRWQCSARDCEFLLPAGYNPPQQRQRRVKMDDTLHCPDHPDGRFIKVKKEEVVRAGAIDYSQVRAELATRGIELRGGAADEAPAAYKRLDDVLEYHGDTITVTNRLRPIGVAMAGADVYDPFKD